MNKKARNLILASGILLFVLVLYMQLSYHDSAKYLFIESKTIENGTVISGMSYYGKNFIDGPTYDLNGSNLYSTVDHELDSSVKAIYGSLFMIEGDLGSGTSSEIFPVRDLPYTCYRNISILDVDGDNVTLSYYGNNFTLMPEDSWKNETHRIEKMHDSLINVSTNIAVYNHGKVAIS